jgi:hypothetical protein
MPPASLGQTGLTAVSPIREGPYFPPYPARVTWQARKPANPSRPLPAVRSLPGLLLARPSSGKGLSGKGLSLSLIGKPYLIYGIASASAQQCAQELHSGLAALTHSCSSSWAMLASLLGPVLQLLSRPRPGRSCRLTSVITPSRPRPPARPRPTLELRGTLWVVPVPSTNVIAVTMSACSRHRCDTTQQQRSHDA